MGNRTHPHFDVPDSEIDAWAAVEEPNSGVILVNKNSDSALSLLEDWVLECKRWVEHWQKQDIDILKGSDQGALRLAVYRNRHRANMLLNTNGTDLPRIQCHISIEVDQEGCKRECLHRHGVSYKYFIRSWIARTVADDSDVIENVANVLDDLPRDIARSQLNWFRRDPSMEIEQLSLAKLIHEGRAWRMNELQQGSKADDATGVRRLQLEWEQLHEGRP